MDRGFAPIVDEKTEILILGSFPSIASLEKQQYYGHPQNHFWKIVGAILNEPLYNLPYEKRTSILLKHNIGIWDVYQQCVREGSLDVNIRRGKLNDFSKIADQCPCLKKIIFNGATAGKFEKHVPFTVEKHIAPSTSPANTMKCEEKVALWKKCFD
jgi:hypoxanthine-DNA glycosylase